MKIYPFNGKTPAIGRGCMIADSVELIGDVVIGDNCSIWSGVIIRSDTTPIRIGDNVHIEENSVLHTSTHIEDKVMVGHGCTIEAFIGRNSMIGNTASLMPLSRIGAFCAVAAGSVVTDAAVIPDLTDGDASISEIAAGCGFESPSAFARAFRLAVGEPPHAYRKRVGASAIA